MKRLIMVSLALLLLSACGRNENISEGMEKDTEQILALIEEAAEEKRESTLDEWDTLIEYEVKYEGMKDREEFKGDEELLYAKVRTIYMMNEDKGTLDSVDDNIIAKIEDARHFMKTGEFE